MNFSRHEGEALQIINVQLNKYNSGTSGSFTVNIGVCISSVAELLPGWLPMPANPKEPNCFLRIRVGLLMPAAKDQWWTVTSKTNIEEVSEELVGVWTTCIAPWLERFRTVSSLTGEADKRAMQHVLTRAAANIVIGDRTKASQLIEALIRNIQNDPYYSASENGKQKENQLAVYRKWAADQGLNTCESPIGRAGGAKKMPVSVALSGMRR
jgi:hypothetical protein